jgi:glucose-6-phosphate isomerase
LMPYADALRDLADWYVQLWAESLGKHRVPGDAGTGPTPLGALGATDQHSQVQLFMEGPTDKTVTFIEVRAKDRDVDIPRLHADVPELSYLGGHSLGELLDIERRATAGALARRGRPNMTISIDRVDAWHVGALFMLFEIATIHAAIRDGVDPLDQPGVELGKQFTYAMLGRADAGAARAEWDQLPKSNPRRTM